ncbi:MAG: hypothetical protein ABI947_00420 [Chloroflexota bacterium]
MTANSTANSPLLRDNRLLLYLFISFRLMLILVHGPLKDYTPGLTAFGDFSYFYDLARTADQGKLPYRDYWFEYPPIIALVSQGVYGLISLRGGDYTAYAVLLAGVLTLFDVGNLLLLRRVGTQLHGASAGIALAWIYAVLAVPLVISFWTFDAIVAFFMLLSITWLLAKHNNRSAIATALGALTKLIPLAVLGAVWRFRAPREAIRYSVIALGLTVIGFAAMFLFAGRFGVASLVIQFNKSSSETVWALIDGNYRTGIVNPDHSDPATALSLQGNPPRVPALVRLAIFGTIGVYVYATTRRRDDKGIVAFIAITITLFYLWSQSWSPQWQVVLIPLILLNFPSRSGVLLCLLLAFISFVEYPVLFSHTGGAIPPSILLLFALLIIARTLLLIGFAVALYQRLRVSLPTVEQAI